jgi:type II secretory pathway pseudopilin PulG
MRTAITQAASPSRKDAGFTLAEALIATLVLTFGLASIFNLMIVATSSNSVANRSSGATMLASEQLEALRSQAFGSAALAPSPVGVNTLDIQTPGFFAMTTVEGVGDFETRWLIQNLNPTSLFISVRTEPRGFRGRWARAEFTTIRTQRP